VQASETDVLTSLAKRLRVTEKELQQKNLSLQQAHSQIALLKQQVRP
jgi:hypothetical protein